ncbi:MAG: hypothetical protein IJL39_05060 [Clostridia bacterium]|nr:hypothetical protein [Clostridia bacterium]
MKHRVHPFSLSVARAGAAVSLFLLGLAVSLQNYLLRPCTYHHLVELYNAFIETALLTALLSLFACLLTNLILQAALSRK